MENVELSLADPLLVGDLTNPDRKHTIVLASGGMDAFYATMSFWRKYADEDMKFTFVHFEYGQIALRAEQLAVHSQVAYLQSMYESPAVNCVYLTDDLTQFLSGHPLMSDEVRARAWAGEDVTNEQLYIPNRNARFMTRAMGLAELIGATNIIFGSVGNVNLDNSLAFLLRMISLQEVAGKERIGIYAPFTLFSKSIVPHYAHVSGLWGKLARDLTVSCFFPYVDSNSEWENHRIYHCGVCGSCRTMKQGIKFACVADPYEYITPEIRKTITPQAIPPASKYLDEDEFKPLKNVKITANTYEIEKHLDTTSNRLTTLATVDEPVLPETIEISTDPMPKE